MFGLKAIFAGMTRLAAALNRSAELFEAANEHLARQLGFGAPLAALEHDQTPPEEEDKPARRNGRK